MRDEHSSIQRGEGPEGCGAEHSEGLWVPPGPPKKIEPHRTVKLPDSLENRSSPPRSAGVSLATRGRAELKSVLLFPFFDWTVVILCARTGRFVAGRKEGGASGGH